MTAALIICVAIGGSLAVQCDARVARNRRSAALKHRHHLIYRHETHLPAFRRGRRPGGALAALRRNATQRLREKWESIVRRAPKIEGHPDEPYACDVMASPLSGHIEAIVGGKTGRAWLSCAKRCCRQSRSARSEDHEGSVTGISMGGATNAGDRR